MAKNHSSDRVASRALPRTKPNGHSIRSAAILPPAAPPSYVRRRGIISKTVVQLPSRPISEYTAKQRRTCIDAVKAGRYMQAVDLSHAAMAESGINVGLIGTISHGILGLPLTLNGDPQQISALTEVAGTAGDYNLMFPEGEAARIFEDGVICGVGLGQLVYSADRAIGEREVPRVRWWDPRWLRQDQITRRWYLLTQGGEIEVVAGDGEWLLFLPYGEIDPWRAPWLFLTLAFVFGRDALFDRQRHSEVLSPARVMQAKKPTLKASRAKTMKLLEQMKRDNYFTLPEEWEYKIIESTGRVADIYKMIIDWAAKEAEIGLTGNTVTTEGNKGFGDGGTIHQRIARDKLRFFARAWWGCTRTQALTWWAELNFGTRNTPNGGYNVDPPEDILAKAKALGEWGSALKQLRDGLDANGVQLDQKWIVEEAQKRGVSASIKPAGHLPAAKLEFAPTDLVSFVTVNEARQSQGLSSLGTDGEITVSAYLAKQAAEQAAQEQPPVIDLGAVRRAPMLRIIARSRGWTPPPVKAKKVLAHGVHVVIDQPIGSLQTGVGKDGSAWTRVFQNDYGFVQGTKAADGEPVDVYLGAHKAAPLVFEIQQNKQDGTPDEVKLMVWFASKREAISAYLAHVPPWAYGSIKTIPASEFAAHIKENYQ